MGVTRVDSDAIRVAVQSFNESSDVIGAAARQLDRLQFDGSSAGRKYAGPGDVVHSALNRLVAHMIQWSRASAEVSAALIGVAGSYATADEHAALGLQ